MESWKWQQLPLGHRCSSHVQSDLCDDAKHWCQQDRLERAVRDEESAASRNADRWLKGFGQDDDAQVPWAVNGVPAMVQWRHADKYAVGYLLCCES